MKWSKNVSPEGAAQVLTHTRKPWVGEKRVVSLFRGGTNRAPEELASLRRESNDLAPAAKHLFLIVIPSEDRAHQPRSESRDLLLSTAARVAFSPGLPSLRRR